MLLHVGVCVTSLGLLASPCEELSHLFLFNLNYIFIHQLLINSALHGRELASTAPHVGKAELVEEVSMDLHDSSLDTGAVSTSGEDEGVVEVGHDSLPLGVHSDKAKLVPDFVNQNVDTKFLLDGDASDLRVFGEGVNFFNGNGVDLIVGVDALHVFAIAFNGVN